MIWKEYPDDRCLKLMGKAHILFSIDEAMIDEEENRTDCGNCNRAFSGLF